MAPGTRAPATAARFVHWLDTANRTHAQLAGHFHHLQPGRLANIPVLFIAGHGDPKFTPEQIATLRRYILRGGLIFSNADGGDLAFTDAIRHKYAPALFSNLYEMRALPRSTIPFSKWIYKINAAAAPHLWGLSNGIREVWIHSADDLAAAWQSHSVAKTAAYQTPANIYLYATGKSAIRMPLMPLQPARPPPTAIAHHQHRTRLTCSRKSRSRTVRLGKLHRRHPPETRHHHQRRSHRHRAA